MSVLNQHCWPRWFQFYTDIKAQPTLKGFNNTTIDIDFKLTLLASLMLVLNHHQSSRH